MTPSAPVLYGLVLAGGHSTRMGQDKAGFGFTGSQARSQEAQRPSCMTWLAHGVQLCTDVCERVFVSVRRDQVSELPFCDLPTIVDNYADMGPAAGLLSAWDIYPDVAWLLLATDLPRLTQQTVNRLVSERDSSRIATGYRHPNGIPEPLCAIWEPRARTLLQRAVERGAPSLRHLLESHSPRVVDPNRAAEIVSVNTPRQLAKWRAE